MEELEIEENKLLELEEEMEIARAFCKDNLEYNKSVERYLVQKKKVEELNKSILTGKNN